MIENLIKALSNHYHIFEIRQLDDGEKWSVLCGNYEHKYNYSFNKTLEGALKECFEEAKKRGDIE